MVAFTGYHQHPSPWFGRHASRPEARVILFCLPFSGTGASIYNFWHQLFPPQIQVSPLHLPGREERIEEAPDLSPGLIARALAERIDRPFAIYGHSLGARLGFEVLRCLRVMGLPDPVRFYPAASSPPDMADTVAECVELPDDQLLDTLIKRLGASDALRDTDELRRLILPLLRFDLGWCHHYTFRPDSPLATKIVAFAGEADTEATPEKMLGWSRHGEGFRLVTVPGGHFFLKTAGPELISNLVADLLAYTA